MRGKVRSLGRLEDVLGLHISLASAAIKKHFKKEFEKLRLTQKQIAILWLVDEQSDVSQSDLARMLKVNRATMLQMIDSLVAKGLVTRACDPGDGRRVLLLLTGEARRMLPLAKDAIARHENWLKSRFGEDQIQQIAIAMRAIYLDDDIA